jgi:antitoxin YefM
VVMVAQGEWDAIQETLHLLSSPKNAHRLHAAIAELDAGGGEVRDLP